MKSFSFILTILLPLTFFGQLPSDLQQAHHTFSLDKDSLTIFQEAEFFSIVSWYSDSDTLKLYNDTIVLDVYYKPETTGGAWHYTSTTKDTFAINNLSIGNHSLVVNSYEFGDSVDVHFNTYEFHTLRDSDTSYFQVLSDNHISFTESPISFYPNPAKEKLTIEGLKPEDGEVEVSIMDMNGKEIFQAQVSYQQPALTLPALPKGTYLVKTSTSSVFQKLLIE